MNVLLVEDSYMLADTLVSALKQEHFMVDHSHSAKCHWKEADGSAQHSENSRG